MSQMIEHAHTGSLTSLNSAHVMLNKPRLKFDKATKLGEKCIYRAWVTHKVGRECVKITTPHG